MEKLLLENFGVLIAGIASGVGGWVFGRKKAGAELESNQIENAKKLLEYYKELVDDLGNRLDRAIENLQKSEIEKQEVIKKFSEATEQIHVLEKKVENLTEELQKYKQLNRKA